MNDETGDVALRHEAILRLFENNLILIWNFFVKLIRFIRIRTSSS